MSPSPYAVAFENGGGGVGVGSVSSSNAARLFVYGIPATAMSDVDRMAGFLRQHFQRFGVVISVDITRGLLDAPSCAFIDFATHDAAAACMRDVHSGLPSGQIIVDNQSLLIRWWQPNAASAAALASSSSSSSSSSSTTPMLTSTLLQLQQQQQQHLQQQQKHLQQHDHSSMLYGVGGRAQPTALSAPFAPRSLVAQQQQQRAAPLLAVEPSFDLLAAYGAGAGVDPSYTANGALLGGGVNGDAMLPSAALQQPDTLMRQLTAQQLQQQRKAQQRAKRQQARQRKQGLQSGDIVGSGGRLDDVIGGGGGGIGGGGGGGGGGGANHVQDGLLDTALAGKLNFILTSLFGFVLILICI